MLSNTASGEKVRSPLGTTANQKVETQTKIAHDSSSA